MKKSILFISCLLLSLVMFGQETNNNNHDLPSHYPLPKVD